MQVDLLLSGGNVYDPAQEIKNEQLDIAIKDKKIVKISTNKKSNVQANVVKDVTGKLVLPGLIDLHTHVYWAGTSLGVQADPLAYKSGVTTFVDAGSAGAGNFPGFYHYVIEKTKVKIFSFLNIYYPGAVTGCTEWIPRFNRDPINFASVPAAIHVGEKFSKNIVGIKVMADSEYNYEGMTPVNMGMEASKQLDKPAMIHIGIPPVTTRELLPALRSGDILTHSFRSNPNSCLTNSGNVMPELLDARKRGVNIDIGHGMGSFSFETAKKMLSEGVQPDTISSDVHSRSIDGPVYDLPTTMSKFLNLGMKLEEVIAASTYKPAKAIGKEDQLGHLKEGSTADISICQLQEGKFEFFDAVSSGGPEFRGNNKLVGEKKLVNDFMIVDGEIINE